MWSVRRCAACLVLCCLAPVSPALAAQAPPWDRPFSPDVAALHAAAAALEPVEEGVQVLLEEVVVRFDGDGGREVGRRLVYRIDSEWAVDGWGQVLADWEPWYQERPEVRARVITADGAERWLDPETIVEEPREGASTLLLSDALVLRAPLPGVEVGALVEEQTTTRESPRLPGAGSADRHFFGFDVPTAVSRLVLDVPSSLPFAWRAELLPEEPRLRTADGRTVLTAEAVDLPWDSTWEAATPPDVPTGPAVAWSTGTSWTAVAEAYAAVVERRIEGADLEAEVAAFRGDATDRRAVIDAILARVHDEVRYTGLELGDAAIVPHAPREVLERGYGDCKDKSTLLLALLRQAGIPAHLALLSTAPLRDPLPELPGFGFFSHAVLYVPPGEGGAPEVWIDATAPYHPAGRLPAAAQGRLALIARRGAAGLVTTPAAQPADNLDVDRRRVELAELGFARVIDTMEAHGETASNLRATLAVLTQEELADGVESYAANTHGGELVDWEVQHLRAPDRPFVMTLDNREVGWAVTEVVDALVAISMRSLLDDLPYALLAPPRDAESDAAEEDGSGGEGDAAERHHDLVLQQPYRTEGHYRVVPPDGYRLVDPPEDLDLELGPARLTRRLRVEDGGVELVATFDTGKRRYSAEEVEATREALEAWSGDDREVRLHFECVGESHLAAGRIGEALEEFRRLVAAHPESAVQQTRLARALLAAGLGEPARRAARRAVELDPDSDRAYQELGWVLFHDLIGRPMAGGSWDREGAAEALRRAEELNPENGVVRRNLAILLEHDAEGRRYAPGADLDAAIAEYRALRRDLDDHSLDENLLIALYRAGRLDEVRELAGEMPQSVVTRSYLLAATAADEGVDAAFREARFLNEDQGRRQVLAQAGQLLLQKRLYPEAAELTAGAARGAPDGAASLLALAERLRRLRRFEELVIEDESRPEDVVRRFMWLYFVGDEEELLRFAADIGMDEQDMQDIDFEELEEMRRDLDVVSEEGIPGRFSLDLAFNELEVDSEGDPATGLRLTAEMFDDSTHWYVVAADVRAPEIVAMVDEGELEQLAAIASRAVELLDRGETEAARRWLDWAREELPSPSADDPLGDQPFVHLWSSGGERGEAAARRAAAALRVHSDDDDEAAAALESLRRERAAVEGAGDEETTPYLELAIAEGLLVADRAADALPLLRRLAARRPDSADLFRALAAALAEIGDTDALRAAAEERLARLPGDRAALWAGRIAAEVDGDVAAAQVWLRRTEEAGEAWSATYNQLAWFDAVLGRVDEDSLEMAHRAVKASNGVLSSRLHTLATVYAELDRPVEARDVLHNAVAVAGEMQSHDWYVVGRIAESYGETTTAVDAYRRVEAPEDELDLPTSTYRMAQRRLEALGADQR